MIENMSFLIKFKGISYLHCQWMSGTSIVENCDLDSVQTLILYLQLMLHRQEKVVSPSARGASPPIKTVRICWPQSRRKRI